MCVSAWHKNWLIFFQFCQYSKNLDNLDNLKSPEYQIIILLIICISVWIKKIEIDFTLYNLILESGVTYICTFHNLC